MSFLARLPRIAVTALITLAMINLLVGVILRYGVAAITNYMDWDSVPFTWVEEVGEMALAWLTLIGAAIGDRSRSHFTLHSSRRCCPRSHAGDRHLQSIC
jgi:TRAP-type C4-dicarboxylate transport system permease small subunit